MTTTTLADPESVVETALPRCEELKTHSQAGAVKFAVPESSFVDAEEYRLLYLPSMLAVYTSRHQQMPVTEEWLHRHVFGEKGHQGCTVCREETEFLVAHQKKFFQSARIGI